VTLLMSHRDQVTALPSDADVVATSDYCVNGAFRVGDHVFTVQGHPEFTPELSAFLVRKRQEDIGDDGVGAGLASLDQPLDSDRVARWIATFLRR
jgi:GMP synthase-like glutamine amidotransferase